MHIFSVTVEYNNFRMTIKVYCNQQNVLLSPPSRNRKTCRFPPPNSTNLIRPPFPLSLPPFSIVGALLWDTAPGRLPNIAKKTVYKYKSSSVIIYNDDICTSIPAKPAACEGESAYGITWKETKPGNFAARACPKEARGKYVCCIYYHLVYLTFTVHLSLRLSVSKFI